MEVSLCFSCIAGVELNSWLRHCDGGPRPLKFVTAEYNGSLPSLVYHPYSWTKVANIIFVDSPLGSGFSYSRKYEGYDWLVEHPQFISNPLYIAGDSYAGKIVPMVAKRILDGIDEGKEPLLNLQKKKREARREEKPEKAAV
ncbi:hypothetical protein ZIOFF_028678 [Zingiber officinale]|uniref:Uncharacterized protein n=1 Tax=Zingiber officinale TaxID=94328 RepID=A0A8J5GNA3_ZINOF|nr:hypothetical protein ZIOFF_028678 [Zingiber officinale]